MAETLKPCPFCGGECRIVKTSWGYCPQCQGRDDEGIWCHMHVLPLPSYNTPEEAAEAWNRRAERTCRKVPGRMKYGRRMPKCSECGQSLGDERWVYCPSCGARVVGNDDRR